MPLRLAAADPGGANVVAAFLHAAPDVEAAAEPVWTVPVSTSRFEALGLQTRSFDPESITAEVTGAWRASPRPWALVTGTSMGARLETKLWELSAADGVPALAWLDQWTNLGVRFQYGRPDWVGAIDEAQREELIAMGFPRDQVLVVGQPYLFPLSANRRMEIEVNHRPGDWFKLLYVSEPFSRDYRCGLQESIGFDEFDVFDVVYRGALHAIEHDPTLSVELAIKLHPYEQTESYERILRTLEPPPRLTLRVIGGDRSGQDAAAGADMVVGVSSVLLLEAMLFDRPVLSLRPGLLGEDPFAPSRRGACLHSDDFEDAYMLVTRALSDSALRKHAIGLQRIFLDQVPFDGADRVTAWLEERSERKS